MNKKIVHKLVVFFLFFTVLLGSVGVFSYTQSLVTYAKEGAEGVEGEKPKAEFGIMFDGSESLGTVDYNKEGKEEKFEVSFPLVKDIKSQGKQGIVVLIERIVDYLKYIFGGIGVLFIIIAGYRLLIAGGQIDEEISKQKETIKWVAIGFIVITIADLAVTNVFFRGEGKFLDSPELAIRAAEEGVKYIKQVVDFIVAFVGTIAVLTIVLSGMRMLMSPGNEEVMGAQKKIFMWAAMGLIIITMADRIVYIFYGKSGEKGVNVKAGLVELAGITNYILGFMGILAAASLIYAGVIMLVNYGNTEMVGKAKTVVRDVMIGIVIAFSAYTIVSAIVRIGG